MGRRVVVSLLSISAAISLMDTLRRSVMSWWIFLGPCLRVFPGGRHRPLPPLVPRPAHDENPAPDDEPVDGGPDLPI
jgi:hypothetical protein